MTHGLYCMICGWMWDIKYKDGKPINADCPNKENHSRAKDESMKEYNPVYCMDCRKQLGELEPFAIETYGADYPNCQAGLLCKACANEAGIGLHSSGGKANE